MRLDTADMYDFGQKWHHVHFFTPNHEKYKFGELNQYVTDFMRHDEPVMIVNCALHHERGREYRPVWFRVTKKGVTTTMMTEEDEALLETEPKYRHNYTERGVTLKKKSGRILDLRANVPVELDFSFPDPGLVTITRGLFKGTTAYIHRVVGDYQLRGCWPGYNLAIKFIDHKFFDEEGIRPLGLLDRDKLWAVYSDLMISLTYVKPITIKEAIKILQAGHNLSVALNRRFALQLSKGRDGFDLYFHQSIIGGVDAEGTITLDKGKEQFNLDLVA